MSDIVQYEKRGRVGIITLNRPEARNAVNGDVASGVEAAIDQVEAGVRAACPRARFIFLEPDMARH